MNAHQLPTPSVAQAITDQVAASSVSLLSVAPDISGMTDADRIKDLVAEIARHRSLEVALEAAQKTYELAGGFNAAYGEKGVTKCEYAYQLSERCDVVIEDLCDCQDRIVAKLKILAGSGALDLCHELLSAEIAGRP